MVWLAAGVAEPTALRSWKYRLATALPLAVAGALLVSCGRAEPAPARPAVAALIAEFARHPVVAIAEYHQLPQAGEFYTALVRDPAFQHTVNDIVVEFASGQSQALLDRYVVDGDSLPPDSLRSIWRNTTKAMSWDSPVYARWLASIRSVNRSLPPDHRLRVLAGDTPVDWSRLHTQQDWAALGPNDVSFARVIAEQVLARHHKALVVLGSNHLGRGGSFRDGSPNTTTRVESKAPGSMYIVLMFSGWPGGDTTEARIARERWPVPSLCPLAGEWVGALTAGNGLSMSRLKSRADALLYLGPASKFEEEGPDFTKLQTYDMDEVDRRSWIEWGDSTRARRFLGLGRVTEYSVGSAAYGRRRRLWVYTPPAYSSKGTAENDLLVAFDGGVYLSEIPLPRMLDSLLAAKRIAPMVAVFVEDSSGRARLDDLANHERFATFIGNELMPWVRSHWKVTRDPHRTVITGSSAGGLASAFLALRRPDLFGNVLSQSGAFWRGAEGSDGAPYEWITSQYASSAKRDVRFFLDVGSTENHGAMNGAAPSILDANRRLRDALRAKGYEVSYTEVPGGVHSPETWRLRLPIGLVMLAGAGAVK